MSDIGLRLFQQLKSIDPNANKDDYFDEEARRWDLDALEEDLKIEQDRLRQQQPHIINNNNNNLNHQQQVTKTTETPMNINNVNNNPNANSIKHQLPVITQIHPSEDQDIDLQHNHRQHHLNVMNNSHPTNNGNPTQMPSPNASPSIDAEYQNNDEYHPPSNNVLITNNNDHNNNNMNNIHLNDSHQEQHQNTIIAQQPKRAKSKSPSKTPSSSSRKVRANNKSKSPSKSPSSSKKSKGGRKRKSGEFDHISSSIPPSKKQKKSGLGYINLKNKWNDAALKKLHSLKRQVRNSAWFWEPVDEIRHSAMNYYLVCQLPSDYGTICSRLEKHEYDDLDVFLRDCELVFINARMYNMPIHPVHKASMELERKFKDLMNTFVEQHCDRYGSDQTLICWQKARKDYKPFAVPVDD